MRNFLLVLSCICATLSVFSQTKSALTFNGSSQFVDIPDHNNLDLSANFTIEGWIFPTGPGSSGTEGGIIINKESSYELARFPDGTLRFALSANGTGSDWSWINTGLTTALNQWSHFAFIKSGTSVTVYVNGATSFTVGSQPGTLAANTSTVRIANRSSYGLFFAGRIDEVRIWSTARTQSQIKTNAYNTNLPVGSAGLVAWYKMDEGLGVTTVNSSTNTLGIDGTLISSPAWALSPIQFSANALSFDGTDDHVVIPHVVSSNFTVEFWMRTSLTGPGNAASQWYGGSGLVDAEVGGVGNDWGTSLTGSVLAFGIGNPDITLHSTSNVNTGNWVHVAATWQQSTGSMQLFINGVLEASGTGSTNLRSSPPRITLGQIQTNIQRFNGSLDEVRIWNIALSLPQILAGMANELDPSAEANLVAYYNFDQGIPAGTNTGITTVLDLKNNNNGTLTNMALSGSSSNFVTQNPALTVLPLVWGDFTASYRQGHVLLTWSTYQESGTASFAVEHSRDGRNWETLSQQAAGGNTNTVRRYEYEHLTPAAGMHYYRIQQKDLDGHSSYSNTRSIRVSGTRTIFMVKNNPVNTGTLLLNFEEATVLSMYSQDGRLVKQQSVNAGPITIDITLFSKGIYILKAGGQSEKLLIQ